MYDPIRRCNMLGSTGLRYSSCSGIITLKLTKWARLSGSFRKIVEWKAVCTLLCRGKCKECGEFIIIYLIRWLFSSRDTLGPACISSFFYIFAWACVAMFISIGSRICWRKLDNSLSPFVSWSENVNFRTSNENTSQYLFIGGRLGQKRDPLFLCGQKSALNVISPT